MTAGVTAAGWPPPPHVFKKGLMATTLISRDPSLQVRTARNTHQCYGSGRFWQSPMCVGTIRKGSVYVAKSERLEVAGRMRWARDLRHYCSHCALAALASVRVGKVAA